MKYSRRIFIGVFWILLGAVLTACSSAGLIDLFWQSFGVSLIVVGSLQVVRYIRYRTNEEYREKMDTASNDERNKFIANKAWAWAGYLFVMIAAIGVIVFQIIGRRDLSLFASFSICLMILLYWGCWIYLKRKY